MYLGNEVREEMHKKYCTTFSIKYAEGLSAYAPGTKCVLHTMSVFFGGWGWGRELLNMVYSKLTTIVFFLGEYNGQCSNARNGQRQVLMQTQRHMDRHRNIEALLN